MTVAHADLTHRLPEPENVDPLLHLVLPEREHSGGSPDQPADMQRLGKLIDAPVVLGVRAPQNFMARLAVHSPEARVTLDAFADIAMREAGNDRAVVLRCWASDLTVALVTLLDPKAEIREPRDVPAPTLYWSLGSRSADATAKADVLDFLRALHQGGELEIIDVDRDEAVGHRAVVGKAFDATLERDWHFLTDVATLEEWSGMPLPLPVEVPADQVAQIRQAAEMVRRRKVPVRFTEDITATVTAKTTTMDELQLEQDFGLTVFGFEVSLGVGRARFPVTVVEARPDREAAGLTHVTLRPVDSDRSIVFELEPPLERVAYKRTVAPDETPDSEEVAWPRDWLEGEREADEDLRQGGGIRFVTEEAFFAWLTEPDDATT